MASPLLFGSAIRQAARQLTRVAGPKLVEARRTVILGERILHVNGTYGSSFRLRCYPFPGGRIDPERPQRLRGRSATSDPTPGADRNQSAAGSLAEGLDETLTLHRLGVYGVLGRSLKTTNGLESINALIEERCAKVDHWQNSNQRQRWLATALLDIEPRLRKVMGYRHLPRLRDALKRELKIDTTTSKTKAA